MSCPPEHGPVVVDLDAGAGELRRRCADVLYGVGCEELAERVLARYPGCLVVSVRDAGGRCVTVTRTGARIAVPYIAGAREQAVLATAVHRWLVGLSGPPAPATGPPAAARQPG